MAPRNALPRKRRFARLMTTAAAAAAVAAGLLSAPPAQALIGQTDAAPGRFPYFAELPSQCGGAMIDPQWMITAAHCAHAGTVGQDVRIGWTQNGIGSPIMTTVLEVHQAGGGMDVALVRVAPRPGVPTVALSPQPLPIGATYTSVAAGAGSNGRLGSAQFRLVDKDPAYWNAGVSVTGTASTCFGDSGSPAIVSTPEGDALIGVTYGSDAYWGGGDCVPGARSYNAAIAAPAIRAWIAGIVPAPDFAAAHRGSYVLRNVGSGQVLDLPGESSAVGTQVIQYPSNGGTNQQWRFSQKDGRTQLVSARSGMVLGVYGGTLNAGQAVVQWTDLGVADQKWSMNATADGHYTIVNENSRMALSVPGASQDAGAAVIQYPVTGGNEQKWDLIDIG